MLRPALGLTQPLIQFSIKGYLFILIYLYAELERNFSGPAVLFSHLESVFIVTKIALWS
jgi:hypothetical protein